MPRAGFVALAGRPNVGKSTLANALVGRKVAIVSDKPQTTRRAIRGVATDSSRPPEWQLVLTDLPGGQRPRDVLTERMQRRVEHEFEEADAVLLVLNGEQGVGGPGDRFIADALREAAVPAVVAVNKIDRLDRTRTVAALQAAADLGLDGEVFPISAATGKGIGPLLEHLVSLAPEGPFLFPVDEVSDQPEHVRLAELVREQVLHRTRQEVPHAVEVQIDEIEEREDDGLVTVRALLWVETESQKGIVIGERGRMIKAIGTAARRELERELGMRVHLDLSVRVRRSWRGGGAVVGLPGGTVGVLFPNRLSARPAGGGFLPGRGGGRLPLCTTAPRGAQAPGGGWRGLRWPTAAPARQPPAGGSALPGGGGGGAAPRRGGRPGGRAAPAAAGSSGGARAPAGAWRARGWSRGQGGASGSPGGR